MNQLKAKITKSKRRFKGTGSPPTFYDRKVLRYGYSATVSMGKIIPKKWEFVRVYVLSKTPNRILIELEKLLGADNHAPTKKVNKRRKQNPQKARAPSGD